jgi:hypothetical protein
MKDEQLIIMKMACYCSFVLPRSLGQTTDRRLAPAAVPVLVLVTALAALLLLGGCSTDKPTGMAVSGVKPLAEDSRLRLGTVALVSDVQPAQFSFDKAKGQIGYAAGWAGTAAGNMLGTSTSEPILDLPVGVGTFVLAPVAAVSGAIGAKKHLSPDKLAECESNLLNAMREMSGQRRFHECLLKAASEKCQGRLVPIEQMTGTGSPVGSPDSVLEARVEELRLERTGSGDTSYRLRIKARMRLLRTADGAVSYDQPTEYRSGTCLFSDWTLHNAFQSVAETGYRQLAEQCVNRLLTTTDRPMLTGAGYRRAPAPKRDATVRLASCQPPSRRLRLQPVSYAIADTGALGIYSTGIVAHVVIQRPLTRDQATSEALSDVDYMFDGLNQHPNMLVALPAAAVATPISLWKQSAALVGGLSPRTIQEADAKLSKAANETRPHEELALQVAEQLAPQIAQSVMLVRQPLPLGAEDDAALMQFVSRGTLASLTGGQTAAGYLLSQGAVSGLEIQVQNAVLAGNGGINPKLALCVEACATLRRAVDGQQLYSCPVQYLSQGRKFTEWAAHDARLFREELQKCYRELSATIVSQLVNRGVIPADRQLQPTFVTR